MKRLTLLGAILGLLVSSCGTLADIPDPIEPDPCRVPKAPVYPEVVLVEDCPEEAVCLTPESAVELGLWVREMTRVEEAIGACPYVTRF